MAPGKFYNLNVAFKTTSSNVTVSPAQSNMPATSVITKEQLSAQDPSNIPEDWKTPGKYHSVCVAIWTAWLNFVPVFLEKQTNDGSVLHLVPPLLPWDTPHNDNVIALLMHYMPTQLTNSVKGDLHPASAKRSDGSLRSNCWELVCQSVGDNV